MAKGEPYGEELRAAKKRLRAYKDRVEYLEGYIKAMDEEIDELVDKVISPVFQVGPLTSSSQHDPMRDALITTWRFDPPAPEQICETLDRFIAARDWEGRVKWLKRCRWRLARRWAKHAMKQFDAAIAQQR